MDIVLLILLVVVVLVLAVAVIVFYDLTDEDATEYDAEVYDAGKEDDVNPFGDNLPNIGINNHGNPVMKMGGGLGLDLKDNSIGIKVGGIYIDTDGK